MSSESIATSVVILGVVLLVLGLLTIYTGLTMPLK